MADRAIARGRASVSRRWPPEDIRFRGRKKNFFVIDAKCTAVVPIKAKPLPKNTNPTHHGGRREARARALNRLLGSEEAVVFTDASKN